MSQLSQPPLQARPDLEKAEIGLLKRPKQQRQAGQFAKRSQQGYGAPHCGKSGSARDDRLPGFLRMKAGKQLGPVNRAIGRLRADVLETNGAAPVETAKEGDLPPAQRTSPIKPDRDGRRRGRHCPLAGWMGSSPGLVTGHQGSLSLPRSVLLKVHASVYAGSIGSDAA